MVKRAHHRSAVRSVLAGTIGTLGALAVSTQAASANHVIVKAGDTIWKIAQQHQTTVSALENTNANTIQKVSDSVDLIYAGQQLTLPDSGATMQADEYGRYTVKPGDTLSKIAQHFHTSVTNLMALNGLSGDQLYIGQHLVVNGQAVSNTVAVPTANAQPVATNETPVASTTPVVNQETTTASTSTTAPVQSASAIQQQPVSAADSTVPNTSSASAISPAPTSASATDQMALAAAVNNADASAATSQASSEVTGSTTASTSQPTSVTTSAATPAVVNAASTAATTSTASQTVNSSQQLAPQPVSSQAPVSASQQAAPQASQAPAQSSQPVTPASAQPQANANQNLSSGSVVSLATKIANTNSVPYVWGGSSLSGMDCSGLVKYVYANAEGKQLPHNTVALESCVSQHSVSEAQAGDILFWGQHGATYHCAIYTGNNQFVAAAKPGTNVASYTISPYFQPSFAGTVK